MEFKLMSIKYKEHLEVKFYDLLEKIVKDGDSLKVTIKKAKKLRKCGYEHIIEEYRMIDVIEDIYNDFWGSLK